ncbi:MAG: DUF2161 family putative PD-(D/E)XK-type phosphodiesterase [Candidatus Tenebribacter davisii]|jgi:hypothetical protein|nr:DUF2161 family putative PD-(D/E)XK-type phosphodiesterase [Candidatus Tenebribacter davisii]
MKESDLFAPLKNYLESNGYKVRAEVRNCDITATKGDELIIIELKLSANLQLLIQAADRQYITDSVYVAIPKPAKRTNKRWKGILHILKRLELGLIYVDIDNLINPVEIVFHPIEFQRRKFKHRKKAIIKEVENRSQNLNVGGSNKKKIITAYKENMIQIAVYLNKLGATSPKILREYNSGEKTLSILYSNFYGWFQRVDRGIYDITMKGKNELKKFPGLIKKYEKYLKDIRDNNE